MRTAPGVIATYVKNVAGAAYTRTSANTSKLSNAERSWVKSHAQELVDTTAWSGSAEVVGMLQDRVSYDAYGDHGGAQQNVQSIPMVFYKPGVKRGGTRPPRASSTSCHHEHHGHRADQEHGRQGVLPEDEVID